MRPDILMVLFISTACYASSGMGIDEEDVGPQLSYDELMLRKTLLLGKYFRSNENNLNLMAAANNDERVIKLNKGVDKILGFIRTAFGAFGELGIPLPDISKPFGKPPYGGTFTATKGYFKNPATLVRTGDVEIILKSGTTLSAQVELGFKTAEVGFNEYKLDVLSLHHEGDVKITVAENSVLLKLTLEYSPDCKFKLDELKFDKLDNIKVDITGLGVFQSLFNELSSWIITNFESNFRDIINKELYKTANTALEKKNVCKYF